METNTDLILESEVQPLGEEDYEILEPVDSPKRVEEVRFWRTRDSIRVAKHRASSSASKKKTLSVKKCIRKKLKQGRPTVK